jgi:hypothetical protein
MRLWAESFGILDYETRVQGIGSETKMRGYFRVGKSEGKTMLLARTTTSGQSMLAKVPTIARAKEAPVLWFEQKLLSKAFN